ncbi:ABC transporter permease [Mangrovactinospora gilvigrisea]|uniref:ABC transporter permease n=1 Tax=Mangrovactinospora gilvigrisea TaxID=1428644 RepID=A0A1J7BGK2_9ACTN|nr:ABC transporter permease [Mangrovactinospora gilvigrisea]
MRSSKAWRVLTAAAVKAELEHRANFLVSIIGGLFYQGMGLAFIWVVLSRFSSLGGWTLPEVAFLHGLRTSAHGLYVVSFGRVSTSDQLLREGEFDRFLTRPVGVLIQIVTYRASIMPIGDLLFGLSIVFIAANSLSIEWTLSKIALAAAAIVGGALVELGLQLVVSGLAMRTLSTRSLVLVIESLFSSFGKYPMKVFDVPVRFFLTFILPLAFIAYFPASVILGRSSELDVPGWIAACSPIVGMIIAFSAYVFWRLQLRHYSSVGS